MAKNSKGEGSSSGSGPSSVEEDNNLMRGLLSQVNHYAEKFKKGMEELEDEDLLDAQEKSDLTRSVENDKEEFVVHLAELVKVIAKAEHREKVIADVAEMEKEEKGVEKDIFQTATMMIYAFRDYMEWYSGVKRTTREKLMQHLEWYELKTLDDYLTKLDEVAQQVLELKGKPNP